MAFENCIQEIRAAGGDAITDEDAMRLLDDVQMRAEILRRDRIDLSQAELNRLAAEQLGAEAIMAARVEARNRKRNLLKRIARRGFYETAPAVGRTPGVIVGLEAKLVGVNTPFAGSRLSVAAQQNALRRDYLLGMTTELDRAGLHEAMRTGAYDDDVVTELWELSREGGRPGASGNRAAEEAARIVHKYQEVARDGLNRAGAWVGKYEGGYVARTAHDADRIRRAGYEGWRARVLETLDLERTFEGVDDRERFLRGVYNGLVTGVHLKPEGGQGWKDPAFTGPGNLARRLSQGRVLHWRSASAWMAYQREFGGRSLIENLIQSFDQAARSTALMREFGTNPRAEFDADVAFLEQRMRDRDPETVIKLREARKWLGNRFDELDGTASMPVNRLVAQIGSAIRTQQSMAKLGGVTLSAIADVPFKAAELRYHGVGLLEGYLDGVTSLVRGRGAGEEREIIDLLRAGGDGMLGSIASRIDVSTDTAPGVLSKVANTFFRWTGLTYWTDAQRAGAEFVMSRKLGSHLGEDFGALPEQTRRLLTIFGISPAEWGALSRVQDHARADGRAFLTPDAALRIADEDLEPFLGPRLDEVRRAALDAAAAQAARLDRLSARLERLQAAVERALPTLADVDRIDVRATLAAYARQADAVSAIRDRVVSMRDGGASTNDVLKTMRREIQGLADAEKRIVANAVRQMDRIKSRIPAAEARRAEALDAIERVKAEMDRRLAEVAGLPDRLEAELGRLRDEARQDLALKLHSYYSDRGEYAVLNPGARERAMLRRGTRPGTIEGEALRFWGQFKAFPVAVISKAWGREVYGGQAGWGRAAGIVHLMVGATVFGYLAGALKDMAKGRTPRDPTLPSTWGAAFAQGGALGIYGDYLVGRYSRFGNTALETFAGPTFGEAASLLNIWAGFRAGDDKSASMLRWALANTPFANLFYTRVALDYLFLYQVQEALNPGFLRRFERRIREDNGARFMFSPAAAIPHGGGSRAFEGVRE